jgi:DNA mismatch repair protein MutS2
MEAAQEAAKELREELSSRLEAIDDERRELLATAKEEFELELSDLREELEGLRRRLKLAGEPLEQAQDIAQELTQIEAQAKESLASTPDAERIEPGWLQAGDRVRLQKLGMDGEITQVGEGEVEVQIGRLRIRAGMDEIKPIREDGETADEAPQHGPEGRVRRSASQRVRAEPPPMELDLRGMRVQEALEAVERRLDSAFLAGMPFIRVIHGKGTGRLREAVREALGGSPYVASSRPGERGEGGNGVTVVDLAND